MTDLALIGLGIGAVGIVLAVVFLVLWRRERGLRRTTASVTSAAARERIELDLALTDQDARLRIISELHDVNIVRVSALLHAAEGAKYSGTRNPQVAVRAAGTMAENARAVLADMRRVSTLVHGTDADARQPTLASVPELVTLMRTAGLSVQLEEHGTRFPLPPTAEVAVYRILQEALGNALTYGGDGTHAHVGMTWTEQGLQVRIDDDGTRNSAVLRGLDPDEATVYTMEEDLRSLTESIVGPGLAEMRERTELFGGVFTASQTPGVGFTVSAVFPTLRHHNGVHGVDLSRGGAR